MADATLDRRLIEAINLLAEYAGEALAPDWEIELRFTRDEASIELTNPDGDAVEVCSSDHGVSTFRALCDESRNPADSG